MLLCLNVDKLDSIRILLALIINVYRDFNSATWHFVRALLFFQVFYHIPGSREKADEKKSKIQRARRQGRSRLWSAIRTSSSRQCSRSAKFFCPWKIIGCFSMFAIIANNLINNLLLQNKLGNRISLLHSALRVIELLGTINFKTSSKRQRRNSE